MFDHPLFQAVLDDPDDDQTRLVLADWLEEQGDVRGEFIRVQIAIADAKRRGQPVRPELVGRESELQRQHRLTWHHEMCEQLAKRISRSLATAVGMTRRHIFYRGFPSWLGTESKVLVKYGDALLAVSPWQYFRLDCEDGKLAALTGWPGIANVRTLTLRRCASIETNDLVPLLDSDRWNGLERLSVDAFRDEGHRWRTALRELHDEKGRFPNLSMCDIGGDRLLL